MVTPESSHPKWSEILTGAKRYEFDFLAAKVLVGSLVVQAKYHPDQLGACAEVLRNLFAKNEQLPSAQKDLHKIFG